VLCGVLLVFAARLFINRTPVADWIVSPLLMVDTSGHADAIVALGAGVTGECLPNHYAVQRVLLSARLWKEGRAPFILYTGASNQSCSVAAVMAELARQVGVPESNVQIEPAARNTHENAERSALVLRALGVKRVLVVTDRLHMRRATDAFAHQGFHVERAAVPIYAAHEDNVSMLSAGLREMVALRYYRIQGWIGTAHSSDTMEEERQVSVKTENISHPDGPIVLLGASYAKGWEMPAAANIPIVNRGMSGEQSFQMLDRFERDVVAVGPRSVIIWGFINDLTNSGVDVDATVARIHDSYVRMIDLSRTHGIEPIVATEVTMRTKDSWSETLASWIGALMGKEAYQDRINRYVIATNAWLVELARKEGIQVLDLQAVLGEKGGRRRAEFTNDDGSHITAAGYFALTSYARPFLDRHFAPAQSGS
jgi:uncharacterized SAM-binding protein YcdF (DUF218 family)/lysophospholipase L1-like esterase